MERAMIQCSNCNGTGSVRFTYANGICFACKGSGNVKAGCKPNDPAWYSERGAVIRRCAAILADMEAIESNPGHNDDSTYEIGNMWRVADDDVRERWLSAVAKRLPKRLAWFKHMANIAE